MEFITKELAIEALGSMQPIPASLLPRINPMRPADVLRRYIDQAEQMEMVLAQAYQVVGSLLEDVGAFDTEEATKILDNLSQMRLVHQNLLPWPSFQKA